MCYTVGVQRPFHPRHRGGQKDRAVVSSTLFPFFFLINQWNRDDSVSLMKTACQLKREGNLMARTLLDKELQALDAQIIHLGSLVDDALAKALDALEMADVAKSGMVIEADAIIDSLRAAIEEHTIRLLTLQQPLGGRDLRYLTSALSIAGDLERTGDGAAGIAQIILFMVPLKSTNVPQVKIELIPADEDGQITEA